MTQRPLQPTGPVSCPPRCGGSSPTTATRGMSGAVAGAPSPLSCSSSGSPTLHLLAPCGSVSALFLVPRRDHLQPPLPPWDRPAPPSCPLLPPQHPPQPAAAQPCPPQPGSSWSPTGPLTPGPCLPLRPAAPSPPTAPVLTQSPWGSVPAASLPAWAWSLPSSLPLSLSERVLDPDPGPRAATLLHLLGSKASRQGLSMVPPPRAGQGPVLTPSLTPLLSFLSHRPSRHRGCMAGW